MFKHFNSVLNMIFVLENLASDLNNKNNITNSKFLIHHLTLANFINHLYSHVTHLFLCEY